MKSKKVKVVTVPVDDLLDMVEFATVRGMQRGAAIVLEQMEPKPEPEPEKPSSPFLGDNDEQA